MQKHAKGTAKCCQAVCAELSCHSREGQGCVLGTVCVGPSVGHGHGERPVMAQVAAELVRKLTAPDALPARAIPCSTHQGQASSPASYHLAVLLCSNMHIMLTLLVLYINYWG